MVLHLRPTDEIEFIGFYRRGGVFCNGEFIPLVAGGVKLLQLLLENAGYFVSITKLMKSGNLSRLAINVYISKMRPAINKIGYSVSNDREQGYKITKMVKK